MLSAHFHCFFLIFSSDFIISVKCDVTLVRAYWLFILKRIDTSRCLLFDRNVKILLYQDVRCIV